MSGAAPRHAQQITRALIPQLNQSRGGARVTGVSGDLSSLVAAERARLCGGTQGRLEERDGSGFSPACPSGTGHSVRSLAGDRDAPRALRGVRERQRSQRRRGQSARSRNDRLPERTTQKVLFNAQREKGGAKNPRVRADIWRLPSTPRCSSLDPLL